SSRFSLHASPSAALQVRVMQPEISLAVNPKMIVEVRVLKPRPYCSKCEVIVTLKDKRSKCLDPESQFTKFLRLKLLNRERFSLSGTAKVNVVM
uniref:Chemokine interleukin-8-like domain-containing protein n=1 Tax=Nothobranchius furzeri TaxID=105023 RepID=A0A8C6PPY0_NOTFU